MDQREFDTWSNKVLSEHYQNKEIAAQFKLIVQQRDDIRLLLIKKERANNPVDKQKILKRFDAIGQIGMSEMALIVEAKQQKSKFTENTCFVLSLNDMAKFNEFLLKLIIEPTDVDIHRLQFIFMAEDKHAVFSEVLIDKTTSPPTLKFFYCDPALTMVSAGEVIRTYHIEELNKVAQVEIYESSELLQKGKGCTYFSIDGAFTLASQMKYGSVYDYMTKHGKIQKIDGYTHIYSPLPARLKRASHLFEDEELRLLIGMDYLNAKTDLFSLRGIKSTVLENKEAAQSIVNKRGNTAENSINKDLEKIGAKVLNKRIDRKRKSYQQIVTSLLDNVINQGNIDQIVDRHGLMGMGEYAERHHKKNSPRLGSK